MPQNAASLLARLVRQQVASRLWDRDATLFAPPARSSALNRLGWLAAPAAVDWARDASALAATTRREGITATCLLGMGGSSLCAEVLRDTRSSPAGAGPFIVLDTTDERAVHDAAAACDPARTLYIVASKSGSTIEVTSLERFFFDRASRVLGGDAGQRFVAITDPDTTLVAHAARHGYRQTCINPPDIGGRYSALSLFGLVPAALLGVDPARLLETARRMAAACRADDEANPGLALGAFMATQALEGRDKLTLLLPRQWASLGVWMEQLVAESTGKDGRGVLPVVDEPPAPATAYGSDRAFVAVSLRGDEETVTRAAALRRAGHPVFEVAADPDELGAEFFRWEFATAIAGIALDVNPFDEPNVREAKTRTQALLESALATGAPRVQPPLEESGAFAIRRHDPGPAAQPTASGRYIAILDYLPADVSRAGVPMLRERIRERLGAASTHGYGPRYLHSTGQFHKGGPNTGVFVLLTGRDATATNVPGTDYSFSLLKQAQALGDFEALVAAGRRVIHIDVGDDFSNPFDLVWRALEPAP